MDDIMVVFNESLSFDKAFYKVDIQGSIAYAKALFHRNLINSSELSNIIAGLQRVEGEWESGSFKILLSVDEDIHTANERRLAELIGPAIAGKLHTGRSRNEQIATDIRLWLRGQLISMRAIVVDILRVITDSAEREVDVLMPGYTHMQRAQPIRFSQWLLSHGSYLLADLQRLDGVRERVNSCPLGVGALAGNPFAIDRDFLAKELGFATIHPNSIAAVADRDFVVETLQWGSLVMVHLSRLSEDLIIYSTAEFGFIRVADAYSTGSSLMPQKKNPDSLELIRGKAGRVLGQVGVKISALLHTRQLLRTSTPLYPT
jgi:argininosuccinate lyase